MDVPGAWAELVPLKPTPVSGQYHISQIETYPASPLAYNYWRGKLANKGWKGGFLFCYDLILVDDKGWQLRVMLHPGSGSVQQGSIMEGMFITMIKATKVPYGDSFLLVLSDWSPGTSFQLQYRGQLQLVDYPNQDLPLCNPHTDLLCPWTCANFLWSTSSPLKMKQAVPVTHHDPAHHNLTNLDQAWHTLSRMWPLVVRVLAKSKDRLVIQQDNDRKPWLALTNLLVADNTAYCVITVWDEAVSAVFQTVKEGDILVLAGRYRVGRYRQANQKLIYRLAPKVRQQGLSPTEMEIKLNTSDLEHVHLVNCAATCPTVPLPLWNFLSINQLVEHGSVANGRLVDFVGLVVHHGRWEREKCQDQTNKPTGQYWIRVWLLLGDHSSEDVVAVKFYVDRERWEGLERAIPGEAVVVTNLLYIQGEQGTFSHLECSNETQVFNGELAGDSRFGGNKVVVSFREALHGDVDRWGNMLRMKGGFGGHIHPPSKVKVTLRTVGFVMERRDEVNVYFDSLVYRGCGRVLVRAKIGGISIYKVDIRGGLELESVEGDGRENGVGEEFGLSVPLGASFVRTLDGLRRVSLQTAIKKNCHLNAKLDADMDQTSIREGYVAIVSLIMEDCQFLVQADISVLDSVKRVLESLDTDKACFCMDLFRFRSQQYDHPIWDGVEVVLRSVLGPQEQQADSQDETGSDKSLLVNTLDMANAFL